MTAAAARRRTRVAGAAAVTLAASLALQPVLAAPAHAGTNCDQPLLNLGDCTAPDTTIVSKPPFESVSPDATFVVSTAEADPDGADVTFECRLWRGYTLQTAELVVDWADCSVTDEADNTALGQVTYPGLAPDDYIFEARASDVPDPLLVPLGDVPNTDETPARAYWAVVPEGDPDGVEPETTITSKPRRWHPYSFGSVLYSSDKEVKRFECILNGSPHDDCGPKQANMLRLSPGDWRFSVAAVDQYNQRDQVPARTRWTVPQGVRTIKTLRKGWTKVRSGKHYRDLYAIATKRGSTFRRPLNDARSAALVVTRCPTCGKLRVDYGKKRIKTIKLRSAKTRTRKVIEIGSWKKPRSGTLHFTVVSQGKDVIVEGVAQSRWR